MATQFAGEVKNFNPAERFGHKEARRMDRVTQLALATANQALDDAGLAVDEPLAEVTGVVLGCGLGSMGATIEGLNTFRERGASRVSPFFIPMILADAPAATISIQRGLRGPNMAIATACAASNNALGEAAPKLARMSSTTFDSQLLVSGDVAHDNPHLYFEIQHLNRFGLGPLDALVDAAGRIRELVASGDEQGFVELMERGREYLALRS